MPRCGYTGEDGVELSCPAGQTEALAQVVIVSLCVCLVFVSICLCVFVSLCLCVFESLCLCVFVSLCSCLRVCICPAEQKEALAQVGNCTFVISSRHTNCK